MRRKILIRKWSTSSPEMPHAAVMGFQGIVRERIVYVEMPDNWSLSEVHKGLWLDKEGNITSSSDAVYWVSPSQILNVEITE